MNHSYLIHLSQSDLKELIASSVREELSGFLPQHDQTKPEDEELLRVPDIQEMFGVCKQTVLSWSKSGKLPTIRIGGRIYFPKERILALLKSRNGR